MKRIQLFEFEDQAWFPDILRVCMTRYILTFHKLLGSAEKLADLLAKGLKKTNKNQVIDMCTGAGGPMEDVKKILAEKHGFTDLKMTLTDLYPNQKAAAVINNNGDPNLSYRTESVDATNVDHDFEGMRTMVCSMHHMPPQMAKKILLDAQKDQQPICIYEISDNSFPFFMWWMPLPINILMVFFITPFVRPMTWQQIVFTYIIPVLPIFIGWDGTVSNARTYTLKDWDIILDEIKTDDYTWEKDLIEGKNGVNQMYLMGYPKED